MSDLNRAIAIAVEAHAGQRDQAGEAYILHPLRVMLSMPTDELRIIGVLHDVVEDSPLWGLSRLADDEGYAPAVVEALRCLTKLPGEPYLASFIPRCGFNDLARAVKIADILDNSNESRLAELPAHLAERLRTKYRDALIALGYDPAMTTPSNTIEELVGRLRNGRDGWSGDAVCVEAETADEAADHIMALQRQVRKAKSERSNALTLAASNRREAAAAESRVRELEQTLATLRSLRIKGDHNDG